MQWLWYKFLMLKTHTYIRRLLRKKTELMFIHEILSESLSKMETETRIKVHLLILFFLFYASPWDSMGRLLSPIISKSE